MAASSSDMFQKVGRSTATTLSAPGYTIGNTTINVGSTANWGDETGVTFAIDEVDSDGERIGGTYNVFRGVVSSATQVSDLTYVGGDPNRDYTAGATTRVYVTVSSYRENRIVDGLLVSHEQDGTLKANTVDTTQLVDEAVTTAKIDDGSVTSPKISLTGETATVETSETTTSTSPADLSTVGPSVTTDVGPSGNVLVIGYATLQNSTANSQGQIWVDVGGTDTQIAADRVPTTNQAIVINGCRLLTGLTPGSTTFKLQYAQTVGTSTFSTRILQVIPL